MNLCGVVKILLLFQQNFKLQVPSTTTPKCIVVSVSQHLHIPVLDCTTMCIWTDVLSMADQTEYAMREIYQQGVMKIHHSYVSLNQTLFRWLIYIM